MPPLWQYFSRLLKPRAADRRRGDDDDLVACAALLNVDGTLVDSNYQHALAWYRGFRRSGILLPLWRIHRPGRQGGRDGRRYLCDIEAARKAGLETVCVITGGFSEQELREAGAVAILRVGRGAAEAPGRDAVGGGLNQQLKRRTLSSTSRLPR